MDDYDMYDFIEMVIPMKVKEIQESLSLKISDDSQLIDLKVESSDEIALKVEEGKFVQGGDFDIYDGSYVVTPKVTQQSLPTKNKLLKNDVTVLEIPSYEVSNLYGKTMVIGGI